MALSVERDEGAHVDPSHDCTPLTELQIISRCQDVADHLGHSGVAIRYVSLG